MMCEQVVLHACGQTFNFAVSIKHMIIEEIWGQI
jgi:hypothetical protein